VVAVARVRRDESAPRWIEEERFPPEEYFSGPGPTRPEFMPHEFGVGVLVDESGLILASLHTLGEISGSHYFVWAQRRAFKAKVKAADPWLDVALLEIAADDLQPIELGDARQVKPGDRAAAIGSPLQIARDGEPSADWGVIAQLACEAPGLTLPTLFNGLERNAIRRETLHHYGTLLKFAANTPATSGGGILIDAQGQLLGLLTTYAAQAGGEREAGYAIPIDADFRQALDTLKQGRLPEYGLLGLAPRAAKLADPSFKTGASVEDVMPGTPAAKVGLRPGDIITHVGDQLVQDDLHLIRLVSALPAEAKITLQVVREPRSKTTLAITATLSKKYYESAREPYAEVREPAWRGMRVDYATASPAFRELARNVDPEGCVAVVDVDRDSPAWKAGLRNGTFVSHVAGKRVSTPRQFREEVARHSGEAVLRITNAGEGDPLRKVGVP
jgi:S1-C subfamily serine protease